MTLPSFTTLELTLADGIGQLVLNQPPSNMMTLEFFREFREAVDFIEGNPEFGALVISGNGRHFSAGAELKSLHDEIRTGSVVVDGRVTEVPELLIRNFQAFLKIEKFQIPVITAIRGVCLGSALELTLFSHFRFCGEDAIFGLPEVSFNLLPGLGGIKKMSSIVGTGRTLELVLKSNTFSAAEAYEMKLVHAILPRRELMTASIGFARSVMENYHLEKAGLYLKKYFA